MSSSKSIVVYFFILICVRFARAYHILALYPQGFKSHFLFNTAILNTLRDAGHEVALITPFDTSNECGSFDASNSSNEIDFKKRITTAAEIKAVGTQNRGAFLNRISLLETLYSWTTLENLLCYDIMKLDEIKNALAGRISFDVVFAEMMTMQGCYLLLAHQLGVPVIGTLPTSPWLSERLIGNPINPVYVPNAWNHIGNKMSLYDRLKNTLLTGLLYVWETRFTGMLEELFRREHFSDIEWTDVEPPALLFLNSHPVLQPRPMVPNAVEIGGVHIAPAQPLPQELQKFLDEADEGVILLTFGTNNSTHVHYEKEVFSRAFAAIPQRVIWKLDQPYKNVTKNVFVTNWVPQSDVLSHRNVKAFISHCGAFGVQEAVHTATPIVGVPLHIDQIHNAMILEEIGVAVRVDLASLTTEILLNALNKVINDTSYREKMRKLSNEFNDNPMSAAERVIYWTEYVIRHKGTPHLKTMGLSLPLYQNLYFDILIFLTIISIVAVSAIAYGYRVAARVLASQRTLCESTKKVE